MKLILPARILCASLAVAIVAAAAVPRLRFENGSLILGDKRFQVRGVAYPYAAASMPGSGCLYARDLPLIAAMGANTVRTYGLVPEGDKTFPAVLDAAGLYWLAGFPLDSFYDASLTAAAQKQRLLDAFRKYALRFRGQPRLIAYVFGSEDGRYSGADFRELLAAAAALLRQIEGDDAPGVVGGTADLDEITQEASPGSLWLWTGSTPPQLSEAASARIVVEYGGRGVDLPKLAAEIFEGGFAGGIYRSFAGDGAGIFRRTAGAGAGLDSLQPEREFYTLAALWRGTYPPAWAERDAPVLERMEPAGPAPNTAAPGSLVWLAGKSRLHTTVPYADEAWPFTLAAISVCIGTAPARLNFLSPAEVAVQIPAGLEPGEYNLVLFRAGQASNALPISVRHFAADKFDGPVLDARLRRSGAPRK